ncbi:universal stress protein [Natronolimnobius baerhuensis]|uniref:Universal stress protein UspA n=1 Tax=Natronolimnobius baerhuensis TaxID=253108 RepID=A0A202E8H1_9EURY|nr:universal stress protein [Natronolimnobius baerhuensis]OVE84438.1 universal stress protein UspA [Natronolimnobius baerhuensis]
MTTHVLVPIDGSSQAWDALDHAADVHGNDRITVIHVINPADGVASDYGGGGYADPQTQARARERGESLCEEARKRIEEQCDPSCSPTLETAIETGQPARAIVAYADEHDVDQIVMGSHGRSGVARLLLGSVAETVTRRARVPVTIVR